ncbi:MAG TPA: YceI family protein, partial [Tenuifilaceae bacterium]|nr:YceI family protein [Tenuifilaceae bacterium]
TSEGSGYKVSTTGTLTISGVTQNVTINATGKLLPNGAIEFTGEKALKMTSFKVEPPTAMFGAMKTGDEVTIDFKVVIKQQ